MGQPYALVDCVPRINGDYLKDILDKYEHIVRIDARNMNLDDLHPIEAWCNEYFGELKEHSNKSPWQISMDRKWGPIEDELCFHFHNEQFAMAFKLRWV